MTADAADKAHENKVAETTDGERLVAHSTYTEGDRELREVQDKAEVDRVKAAEDGYVAAPGVGDYHATRRAAKQAVGVFGDASDNDVDGPASDPSAVMVEPARKAAAMTKEGAAEARKAASGGERRSAPTNRRSRPDTATTSNPAGADGGNTAGAGEAGDAGASDAAKGNTGTSAKQAATTGRGTAK